MTTNEDFDEKGFLLDYRVTHEILVHYTSNVCSYLTRKLKFRIRFSLSSHTKHGHAPI